MYFYSPSFSSNPVCLSVSVFVRVCVCEREKINGSQIDQATENHFKDIWNSSAIRSDVMQLGQYQVLSVINFHYMTKQ